MGNAADLAGPVDRQRLTPLLPYENSVTYAGQDNLMLLRDGGVGAAYAIAVPATESTLDGETFTARAIDQLVRSLPAGYTFQVYRRNVPGIDRAIRAYQARCSPVGERATQQMRGRIELFERASHAGFLPQSQADNYFTTTEELVIAVRSNPRRGLSLLGAAARAAHEDTFRQAMRNVRQALAAAGLNASLLPAGALANFAASLLNPFLVHEPPRDPDLRLDDASEAVAARLDLRAESEHGWSRGFESHWREQRKVLRVVSLMWQPEAVAAGLLDQVLQPLRGVCAVADFHLLPQMITSNALRARRFLNSRMRTPFNAENIDAIEESISMALQRSFAGERFVSFRLQIIIAAPTAEAADEEAAYIANTLDVQCSVPALFERDIGGSLLVGSLPYSFNAAAERAFARRRRMMSFDAARLTFASGTWSGTLRSVNVLHTNRWGRALGLNTYEAEKNANFLVAGSSGGGKTFFLHDMVMQEQRIPGARFYLTSTKADYRKLALVSGRYVEVDLDGRCSINPFGGPPTFNNAEFWTSMLESMLCDGDHAQRPSRDERLLLTDAAMLAAQDSADRYEGARETLLSHIITKMVGFEGELGKAMARRFRDYHGDGKYAALFDRPRTVTPEDTFIFFNLKNVAGISCYQSVVLAIFTFIDSIMTDPQLMGVQKTFVTDEGWSTMRDGLSASLVERAARVYRSLGGRFGAVSQLFDDYDSQFGRAILQSTATKFVLPQDPVGLRKLRDYISVNDEEFELIRSLRVHKGYYGEYFTRMEGRGSTVGRVVPTPEVYALATTDPEDEVVIERWTREEGSLDAALTRFAHAYPRGVAAARG